MSNAVMVSGLPERTSQRRLNVLATVGRAYRAAFSNAGLVVRIAWVWAVLLLALQLASVMLLPSWLTEPSEIMRLDGSGLFVVACAALLNGLLVLPALASIAVNWHRALLLGEQPGRLSCVRLDGPVWSYVAMAAVLSVLRFAASLPELLVSPGQEQGGLALNVLRAAAVAIPVASLVLLPRLSLGLPGVAIGDRDAGIASGFRAGRGNTWRLCAGAILCLMPALLVGVATFAVWPGPAVMLSPSTEAIAVRAGLSMIYPFVAIVFVGFLSYAYEHAFPERVAALRRA